MLFCAVNSLAHRERQGLSHNTYTENNVICVKIFTGSSYHRISQISWGFLQEFHDKQVLFLVLRIS